MRRGWDLNPRTAAPEEARPQQPYIWVPHRRPEPLPVEVILCYPKGWTVAMKSPTQRSKLCSWKAHGRRDPGHQSLQPSPPPQTPLSFPRPLAATHYRLSPLSMLDLGSALGLWVLASEETQPLRASGPGRVPKQRSDSLSRVRAATVTGFWCGAQSKMKAKGSRPGRRRGMAASVDNPAPRGPGTSRLSSCLSVRRPPSWPESKPRSFPSWHLSAWHRAGPWKAQRECS